MRLHIEKCGGEFEDETAVPSSLASLLKVGSEVVRLSTPEKRVAVEDLDFSDLFSFVGIPKPPLQPPGREEIDHAVERSHCPARNAGSHLFHRGNTKRLTQLPTTAGAGGDNKGRTIGRKTRQLNRKSTYTWTNLAPHDIEIKLVGDDGDDGFITDGQDYTDYLRWALLILSPSDDAPRSSLQQTTLQVV